MSILLTCAAIVCFLSCFFICRAIGVIVTIALQRRQRDGENNNKNSPLSSCSSSSSSCSRPIRTLVILGSGGHTAEMLSILNGVNRQQFDLHFIRAATDTTSEARVRKVEDAMRMSQLQDVTRSMAKETNHSMLARKEQELIFYTIPRSREVGQSYLTSIRTTLIALFASVSIILNMNPEVILCNGPGTGVPLCVVAFLAKVSEETYRENKKDQIERIDIND